MIVYMLRSLDNGKYYKKTAITQWVEQEKATVWSEKWGVATNKQKARGHSEIVSFTLEEIK